MLRKGKSAVADNFKKSWSEIEMEGGVEYEKSGLEFIASWRFTDKNEASHLVRLRGRH